VRTLVLAGAQVHPLSDAGQTPADEAKANSKANVYTFLMTHDPGGWGAGDDLIQETNPLAQPVGVRVA
jgi:hypothetical protein